jgi:hypothetical protein
MDYRDREEGINTDGTPLFASDYDKASEKEVAQMIEGRWQCDLYPFGRLCPVDFYAVRDGRLVGVLELKTRSHHSGRFPDVFLNVRKWVSLLMASHGLGVPAVFVVKFSDQIGYSLVNKISTNNISIAGCREVVKSHTDVEPVIHVSVKDLMWL